MNSLYRDEKIGVPLLIIATLFVFTMLIFPAGFWFKVGEIDVGDASTCEEIVVDYPREIRRDFEGAWRVAIFESVGSEIRSYQSTPWNYHPYSVNATTPDPVSFEWFTGIDCDEMKAGHYVIQIDWKVNVGNQLLFRSINRSDEFTIWGE